MKYLIVQDWTSTSGNHAGMVHMCNLLKAKYPKDYTILIMPENPYSEKSSTKLLQKLIRKFSNNFFWFLRYYQLCKPMIKNIKDNDEIFLLEYCLPWMPQYGIAKYLRKKYPSLKINALSHLSPTFFHDKTLYPIIIKKWSVPINKMLTLGTSLSNFFIECGLKTSKISTGVHYVDNDYYHKTQSTIVNKKIKLIVMGNMQRDYSLLAEICRNTPDVDWIICSGKANITELFNECPNVNIKGYLTENELKNEMNNADISINIMRDTIGSNVVTTSLAMGLAMICSNVGSIKDYCNNKNTIFCENNAASFIDAINYLVNNKDKISEMKKESLLLSKKLTIEKIHHWFCNL